MTLEELGSIINKIVEITFQFFCGFKKSQVVTKSKNIMPAFREEETLASLSLLIITSRLSEDKKSLFMIM